MNKKKKKKKKILIAAVVVIVIGGGVVKLSFFGDKNSDSATIAVAQDKILLEKMDLEKTISVTGTFVSTQSKTIFLDLTDTLVSEVMVKTGDIVTQGDVICKLDGSEIAKKIEIASKTLATTKAKKAIELEGAENEYEAAKNALDKVSESNQDILSAKDALLKAELSLKILKVGHSSDNAQIENEILKYREQLKQCEVKASMSGVITSVSMKQGEVFKGGEVAIIQNPDSYRLTAYVDQYEISNMKKGIEAVAKTDATGDEKIIGVVDFVSPVPKSASSEKSSTTTSNSTSNAVEYEIEISLKEGNNKLRIGMTAKVKLILNSAKEVFAVPSECITTESDGKSYIRVNGNEQPDKIEVKKGLETDYYVEISGENLSEGIEVLR